MANTLYFAAYPSAASTPTWARANIGTNAGFSGSPTMYGTKADAPATGTNYEPTITWTGSLTAGTSYKLWAIWDDGSASSNSGAPFGSDAFEAIFTSTGALTAQSATVAGTAAHYTLHASTGALAAGAAVVSGTAERIGTSSFDATGALTSQSATVAGTASHLTLHASTGAMAAQAAIVAGTAAHYTLHEATGALEAQAATVAGTAAAQAYQQIVLSLPTVIDITATTARGRVTATEYA